MNNNRNNDEQEGTQVPLFQEIINTNDSRGRTPHYQKAIDILNPLVDSFQTPENEIYVTLTRSGVKFNYSVNSSEFRRFIISKFREIENKVLTKDAIERVKSHFEAVAFDNIERHSVYKRVAYLNGVIYYDLCNNSGEVVEVTSRGWRVVTNPPVRFVSKKGMLSNVKPSTNGNINLLRKYLRLDDTQWILLVSSMLDYLYKAPYPILSIIGQQGSSKTTTSKVISKLLDPNEAPINSKPRDERDLFIMASNAHLLIFDNLSGITHQTSDTFCRLATGGGFRTRQLYSDADEKMIYSANPIISNGIDNIGSRGDLISRMIQINLPTISPRERLTEDEFWKAFESDYPLILGGMFDSLSIALKNLPAIELGNKPRMADFAVFSCALSEALGSTQEDFMSAYLDNIKESNQNSLELDPLATALERLVASWDNQTSEWVGTMTVLLRQLSALISISGNQHPKTPQALSSRLKRLTPMLYSINIGFEQYGREAGTGNRLCRLYKIVQPDFLEVICDNRDDCDTSQA